MRKGQTTLLALFTVGILVLGIILIAPGAKAFFLSMQGDDGLFNFLLDYIWLPILLAAVLSYFTFMAVVRAQ